MFIYVLICIFFPFSFFLWTIMWTIFKVFNLLQCCFCFKFWFFFWPWSMWDLSSPTKVRTPTPCTGRQSLNRWTAEEAPVCILQRIFSLKPFIELYFSFHRFVMVPFCWPSSPNRCLFNKRYTFSHLFEDPEVSFWSLFFFTSSGVTLPLEYWCCWLLFLVLVSVYCGILVSRSFRGFPSFISGSSLLIQRLNSCLPRALSSLKSSTAARAPALACPADGSGPAPWPKEAGLQACAALDALQVTVPGKVSSNLFQSMFFWRWWEETNHSSWIFDMNWLLWSPSSSGQFNSLSSLDRTWITSCPWLYPDSKKLQHQPCSSFVLLYSVLGIPMRIISPG